jgi:hypothetical protein
MPRATSETAEEVLGEPVADTESTPAAPSSPAAEADPITAEAPESSSLQHATAVDESAPMVSPFLAAPQELDAFGSAVRATSPEIVETGEGSRAQLSEPEDDARILDLAHFLWAAAFKAGDDAKRTRSLRRATPLSAD